ncbi:kinase-like protein [Thelephora ganbajun]|uniref:Kinase-like protein n=1 Tax=Thelephora ganbajun TaxID=370292 RepID=A0ACB6ZDG2_THEGA|nr:kinase-like protein [Thelephora ganbajun]
MFPGSPPITAEWPIASGSSCDVYEGFLGDSKVCVKRLRIYSSDGEERAKHAFCQEVVVWKHLSHPNIVPFLGVTTAPFQFISSWMTGGELSEYINTHPCADRLGLISDVADGLNYLHSHNIIHGDLKGPSVLMDDAGRARLTDFGLSAVALDFGSAGSIKDGHAMRWAAPEILDREKPVSKKSDIYSFSMVVVEAFTGKAPFYGIAPTTVAVGILSGNRPTRPTHPDLTDDLWEIIQCCWSQDLGHRPDISEVVLRLRTTVDPRRDHADVKDDPETDDTTSASVQSRGLPLGLHSRPSRWAPISCVFQRLCALGKPYPVPRSTSDAELVQDARPREYEKSIDRRRQSSGASNVPRTEGFWLLGYRAFRRPRTAK